MSVPQDVLRVIEAKNREISELKAKVKRAHEVRSLVVEDFLPC